MPGIRLCWREGRSNRSGGKQVGTATTRLSRAVSIEHSTNRNSLLSAAAHQGLVADKSQLGDSEISNILASGLCGMALTVSAVCCK